MLQKNKIRNAKQFFAFMVVFPVLYFIKTNTLKNYTLLDIFFEFSVFLWAQKKKNNQSLIFFSQKTGCDFPIKLYFYMVILKKKKNAEIQTVY